MWGSDQKWRYLAFSVDSSDGFLGGDEYVELSDYERPPFAGSIANGGTIDS